VAIAATPAITASTKATIRIAVLPPPIIAP
jgi:hypothetical protein